MPKFELFGTRSCPYTQEMREWLEWKGYEYVEYDVETDREARARMIDDFRRPAHGADSGGGRRRGADRLAGPGLRRRWITKR